MMKSFFKKLAFVMALAMVVTLAAPAGSAMAAEALRVVTQETNEVVTEWNITKVGETQDFKFWDYKGAEDWKNIYQWSSDNEAVATVDTAGVVTAVAEGEANITITVGDYVGTVKVTVGEVAEEVDNSYVYDQKSHIEATFTFNHDVNYTADDITLTKVFEGGYEVNWPIETVKVEKNVVTIAPYVEFADGDTFVIRIGAEDVEGTKFTTTFGVVDYVEVSYKSLDEAGVAYAKLDEDDEDIEVILDCKLYSNGVDVTNATGYSKENVEYVILDDTFADIDENILVFEAPGKLAQIKAVYTYEVDDEEKTVEFDQEPIISVPAPKYGITSVDKFTIVKEGTTEVDWNNVKTWMPAFDDAVIDNSGDNATVDYTIAILMTDSYDNKIVYPSWVADISKKVDNKAVMSLEDIAEDYEDAEYYSIEFKSTNDNKVFVGNEDGIITTIGESKAPVLVSLYNINDDGDEYLVKNLTALSLEIKAERKADKATASANFEVLPSDGTFTTGTVKISVVDQYGDPYVASKIKVEDAFDKADFSAGDATVDTAKATYSYEFDGKDFNYTNSKGKNVLATNVKFNVTVDDSVKTSFSVKVDAPEYDKNGVMEVEDLTLTATDKDMAIAKKADGTEIVSEIKLIELSNDLQVGIKDDKVTLLTNGSNLLKDGKGVLEVTSAQAAEGDVFVVIYDKNGVALSAAEGNGLGVIETAPGEYSVRVANNIGTSTATGSAMSYMGTGEYTVKAYTITRTYTDKVSKYDTVSATFTVSNSTAAVKLKEQTEVDLTGEALTIEEVVKGAFKFNFGSNELDLNKAVITNVDYKYNAGSGRVYVYSVEFEVPLNNAGDDVYFKTGKVTVNKYVEIDSLAE